MVGALLPCARSGSELEQAREEVKRLQYKVEMLQQNAELNAEAVEAAEKTRRKNDVQVRAHARPACNCMHAWHAACEQGCSIVVPAVAWHACVCLLDGDV